jgi:peroxiredoxin
MRSLACRHRLTSRVLRWAGLLGALWGLPGLTQTDPGALVALPEPLDVPDFTLTDTQRRVHRLSAYRGRVVLINFWATWCAPCRQEMPAMQRAWEQVRDRDVLVLAVNIQDHPEPVERFIETVPVQFPVLLGGDEAMMREWSVQVLPTSLVIDPQGRARYRVVGAYHWDRPDALEALLALRDSTAKRAP